MKLKLLIVEILKWFYLKGLEIVVRRNFFYLEILTLNFSKNQDSKRSLVYLLWQKRARFGLEVFFVRIR